MWGKTYQCQISNAGGWFIGVSFSKFHDFSMTFDDFSEFHDFPWLFQKMLSIQVFQTLWEPCFMAVSGGKFSHFDMIVNSLMISMRAVECGLSV